MLLSNTSVREARSRCYYGAYEHGASAEVAPLHLQQLRYGRCRRQTADCMKPEPVKNGDPPWAGRVVSMCQSVIPS